jgi:cytochrome P450
MRVMVPGPRSHVAVQTFRWLRTPVELLEDCRKEYGATFRLRLPQVEIVLFSEPGPIREIFTSRADEMHAGEVYNILRVIVGESSVLLLDGARHLRQRKLLLPPFHGERMRLYGATMAEVTRRVLSTFPQGEPFALHPHTQEITLEVILRTVFGAEEGAELRELSKRIKRMLALGEFRAAMLPMLYLSRNPQLESRLPWRWLLRRRNLTDALLFEQISRRRRESSATRSDVLALMLDARDDEGNGMTDLEVRDELMTALAAGHETTATALAWAFERILSSSAVHARLVEEIRGLGTRPDPERLAALPYLDATIKEVLRLRPVIPIVGRVLKRPFRLGGHDLSEGTAVAACIYLAHRNPEIYPEPDTFRPERFIDAQPDPYAWLPFGGGIRRCLGAAFAMYEMKIVLGTLLSRCDFTLAQPSPVRVRRRAVTFWPEGGTRVVARRAAASD